MNGSVIEEKPSFKMLGLNFLSKLDWGYYIISIGNIASAPDFCAFFEKTFLNLFFIVAVPRTAVQPTSSEEKGCSPFNSLHNSEQIFLKISTDEYCSTIFTSSHRIHNVNIAFQFQCKQFCSIQKS